MRQPFFILGTARCGSTRLWQILNAHPRVFLTNESRILDVVHFFASYSATPKAERLPVLLDEQFELRGVVPEQHVDLFADVVRDHARAILEDFYARAADDPRVTHWGDKLPDAEAARAVREVLPATRYVALVRDPRDAWCSWKRFRAREEVAEGFPAAAAIDVAEFAHNWQNLYRATAEWFPDLIRVRYEDLVGDPEATVGAILGHLGLEWCPEIGVAIEADDRLRYHATTPTPQSSVGRWHRDLSDAERTVIESVCGSLMAELGYGHGR